MIETSEPKITVDELMVRIREEMARKHSDSPSPASSPEGPATSSVTWTEFHAALQVAHQRASMGTVVPAMRRWRGITRLMARLTARVVLYFSRVITVPKYDSP